MKDTDVKVLIFDNEMRASIELMEPEDGQPYKFSEVEEAIKRQKVVYGVDHGLVEQMIKDGIYNQETTVAFGDEKVDGVDGYYDFKFNTDLNQKPQMNEDGSVNYWKLHVIELVEEGQEIVEMIDPIDGKNGMTVTGKAILYQRGKPVPALQGRGFEKRDEHHYVASHAGKIEKVNDKVFVAEVYEINGDVDMKTGNIDFRGDVVIHGNVTTGMVINATGSVTIDGTVEAASIKAGKDVIIRGGFIGGYKGLIDTEQNLLVKFLEFGTIRVSGSIRTDSILNCHVTCYDHIYMEGKRANILGGYVYAACGVEVYCLGSDKEIETKVVVGIERMHLQEIIGHRGTISESKELLKKIDATLEQFEKIGKELQKDVSNDPKRVALLRSKIKTQSDLKVAEVELARLEDLKVRSKDASVKAIRDVYPGVSVTIGTEIASVKDQVATVEFKLNNGKIGIYSMKAN